MKKVSILATMLITALISGCDNTPKEPQFTSITESTMKDENGNPVKVITAIDSEGNRHNTFVDTMTGAIIGSMIGNITGNYISNQWLNKNDENRRGTTSYYPYLYNNETTGTTSSSKLTNNFSNYTTNTTKNISPSTPTTPKPTITARGSSFKGMSSGFGG